MFETTKYENIIIQDMKWEINYFAELKNRYKQGANLYVNDDLSVCP